MKRNTITTLGNLRFGDRFCFPGKQDVWGVVTSFGKNKMAINQFRENGKRMHTYDVTKSNNTAVRFLRHTVLEFGDDGLIEQLEPGDVFTIGTNIIKEYKLTEKTEGFCRAESTDGSVLAGLPFGTEISFIKKADGSEKSFNSDKP